MIEAFQDLWREVDVRLITTNLTLLLIAYLFALPIAWNRESEERSAGLRTFPLVAVAACGYTRIGMTVFGSDGGELARVIYGVITGIGFIGGGAILQHKGSVRGTATAASIWNTGAIGVAVANKVLEIALLLAVINFVTLQWVRHLKSVACDDDEVNPDDEEKRAEPKTPSPPPDPTEPSEK